MIENGTTMQIERNFLVSLDGKGSVKLLHQFNRWIAQGILVGPDANRPGFWTVRVKFQNQAGNQEFKSAIETENIMNLYLWLHRYQAEVDRLNNPIPLENGADDENENE